jgi:hypothetical protein
MSSANASEWHLGNEFALVELRLISGRQGEWVEVSAPRYGGRTVRLDPAVLEILTAFSPDELTDLYREAMRRAHPEN